MTERHPASQRFHEILANLADLHDRKQADYGRGNDPFANVRASEDFGVRPWVGAVIRLNDKVRRLASLATKGELKNESAEDSLRDIAVYAVIALVLMEQEQQAEDDRIMAALEANARELMFVPPGTPERQEDLAARINQEAKHRWNLCNCSGETDCEGCPLE